MNKLITYRDISFSKVFITLFLATLFINCKSSKAVISSGEASNKLSAKQVIKQHEKSNAAFNTLQAKVRIDLIEGEKEQGLTFNFRMERDKVIWLSAPLGIARMMVTPDNVRFYNKQSNEYFDGDYALLSDFVGVELDFIKVQNILLGQAIFDLKGEPHKVSVNNNSYALQPKDQNTLLELFYLINPSHFKMDSLQLYQQLQQRILQVDYSAYQEVKASILPKDIRVIATEGSDQVEIKLNFKSVSVNEEVRFPFRIPNGFREIEIK